MMNSLLRRVTGSRELRSVALAKQVAYWLRLLLSHCNNIYKQLLGRAAPLENKVLKSFSKNTQPHLLYQSSLKIYIAA